MSDADDRNNYAAHGWRAVHAPMRRRTELCSKIIAFKGNVAAALNDMTDPGHDRPGHDINLHRVKLGAVAYQDAINELVREGHSDWAQNLLRVAQHGPNGSGPLCKEAASLSLPSLPPRRR